MVAKKFLLPSVALIVVSMSVTSCGFPSALGRSLNRILTVSVDDESGNAREAMFDSLREIHREGEVEAVNPPAADSTR